MSKTGTDQTGRLLRAAGTVGGMTLVSRVLGLVRDIAQSTLLGAGVAADAWYAAFVLPSTLRRLVGEGNISAAFIPVLARQSAEHGDERARELSSKFFTVVLVAASGLSVIGILGARGIVWVMYSGYAAVPGKFELTVDLTRAVFGYLLFISLTAVLMGILNARQRFAAAAFTPVLLNIALIAAAFLAWGELPETAVWVIAGGAMVGGVLQFLFLVPFVRRFGVSLRPSWPLGDRGVSEIGRLMIPGVVGASVVQINILVGRSLASDLPEGTMTSLYFASRVNELTLGVFAVAVATVVLPLMSQQGAAGDTAQLRGTLGFALRQVTAVTLPAAVGIMVLRHDIIATLFEYGQFSAGATALTAAAVWGYAWGLVATAGVRIAVQSFYAMRDTRTPVIVATGSMVVNVVGCVLLRGPLENAGIALANSIAAAFSLAVLLWLLRGKLGGLPLREPLASFTRAGVAAAVMAAVLLGIRDSLIVADSGVVEAWVRLFTVVLVGGMVYLAGLAVLRAPEIAELRQIGRRQAPATLVGGSTEEER
ncbi:MAG: murein biosynthesis integral membrane protein MurJ [Acidobacteria bacterium]|nr:murein biosynthesis integral membrane protein MurJ [Acidobacteriota bacterium]